MPLKETEKEFYSTDPIGHPKIAYLGGPMSDYPKSNFDKFELVESILRGRYNNWEIWSPRENDIRSGLNVDGEQTDKPQSLFLRWDFARIAEDAACVIFLPGWRQSIGSRKEFQVARWTGKPVYEIIEIDALERYVVLRLVEEEEDPFITHMGHAVGDVVQPDVQWSTNPGPKMRKFDTGATRNVDTGKLDFEGFLSPIVLQRYAEYLNKHRFLEDGQLRASDNWQQGIPRDVYMKSGWRHFHDWWWQHRGYGQKDPAYDIEESICALIFNASGYLHELLKERDYSGESRLD